jgi:eukaryotic-like serine/threonine-protein kinase
MSTTSASPATLGKYQILGVLGRGAMGTVYDGWDPLIGRRVAIKTVRVPEDADAESQEGLARFKNEAQAAGRLSHPNIVAVYDYGEEDDTAFIVMEFVEGGSLKDRVDAKEVFALAEIVRIMEQILAGLQYSHDKGVIHRDIKPANVMTTKDGQVKLADFGIARIESSTMTQAGTMLGTPAYMSPEQLMAQTVDARTDIYSSGVLLYQLLTGERPFEGGLTAIIHKALNTSPPQPSEISVTAPLTLDPVIARAMAKRPDERYPNADAFARAIREAGEPRDAGLASLGLGELGDDATQIRPNVRLPPPRLQIETPPSSVPGKQPTGKNLALIGGGAVVLCGLLGGGAWYALRSSPPALPAAPIVAVAPPAPVVVSPAPTPIPAVETPRPQPQERGMTAAEAAALRGTLQAVGLSARCSLASFDVSDTGAIEVSGLVGAGEPDAALREAIRISAPAAAVTWRTRGIDGPYCDVFDIVRLSSQPSSPVPALTLKDNVTHLVAHDFIWPLVRIPAFPAYLLVDYFQQDGSVAHLYPIRGVPNPAFQANTTVTLGTMLKDRVEVAEPFGTDLIVATVSSVPLFPLGSLREDETAESYLPALRAAIDAAQARNSRLGSSALIVDTTER